MKNNQIYFVVVLVFVCMSCTKQVGDFHEGLAVAKKFSKYGYVDVNKKTVIKCVYDDAKDFHDGISFVKSQGKWGAITKESETIIPFEYDSIYRTENGVMTQKGNKGELYGKEGKRIIPESFDEIESTNVLGDNLLVKNRGKYKLYSKEGILLLPQTFDEIEPVEILNGNILIKNAGRYTLCSSSGESVLPFEFESIGELSEGVRVIKIRSGEFKLLDTSGNIKEVGGDPYEICGDMTGSYVVRIKRNGKYGFININGVEVIPCMYDDAKDYMYGYAKVKRNGKWGCVSELCIEVVPCIYDDVVIAKGVHNVRDVAVKSKGKWAIGNVAEDSKVSPHNSNKEFTRDDFIYDDVIACGDNFIIKDSRGYAKLSFVLDNWAMEYVERKYYITGSTSAKVKVLNNENYAVYENGAWFSETVYGGEVGCEEIRDHGVFRKNGKWGVYAWYKDKLLVPNEYDEIGYYVKNENNIDVVPARKGKNWYYIDYGGNVYEDYGSAYKYCGTYVHVHRYNPNKLSSEIDTKQIARYQLQNGTWGYTGLNGTYEEAHDFKWDAARVKDGSGDIFFIDYNGSRVFPNRSIVMTDIHPFKEGFAVVQYSDGRYGYIDKNGNPRFARYEIANDFNNGRARVAEDASWSTFEIDTRGRQITNTEIYTAEANAAIGKFVNGMKTGGVNSLIEHSEKTYQHVMNHVLRQTQGMP